MAVITLQFARLRNTEAVFRTARGLEVTLPLDLFPAPPHTTQPVTLHLPAVHTDEEGASRALLNRLLRGELALPEADAKHHDASSRRA